MIRSTKKILIDTYYNFALLIKILYICYASNLIEYTYIYNIIIIYLR